VLTPNENVGIVYGDIDNDNDIDYASSLGSGEIYWFNNTDSSFTYFTPILIGNSLNLNSNIDYILMEDVNNDNNLDLIQMELSSERIYTYLNDSNGTGNFSPPIQSYINNLLYTNGGKLMSKDINGDGLKDLVGGDSYHFWWIQNMGNGTFSNATNLPSNNPFDFDMVDLDNDNDIDIIVTLNYGSQPSRWLENDGNGDFSLHEIIGMRGERMTLTDVDGDNNLDIITFGAYNSSYIDWYEYVSDSTFTKQTLVTNFDYSSSDYPESIYCKDIDNDLDPDIVLTYHLKSMSFENSGNLIFNPPTNIIEAGGNTYINGAFLDDFNLDGNVDFFTSTMYGSGGISNLTIGWNENLGNGVISDFIYLKANFKVYNHAEIQLVDIDNDGDNDIFGNEVWLENNGNEVFRIKPYFENSISSLSFSPKYPSDIDNDGDIDLIFYEDFSGVFWYENNGLSEFNILHQQPNLPFRFKNIKLIDLDNDNDDDLIAIIQNPSAFDRYQIISIINDNGIYNLQQTLFTDVDFLLRNLNLKDFNNDGNIDIFFIQDSSPLQNLKIIYGSGNGTFSNLSNTIFQSPQHIKRIEPAIIDSDNWIDYIALYQDSVSWFSNIEGTSVGSNHLVHHINFGNSQKLEFTHGDFNSDGLQDIACIDYSLFSPDSLIWFSNQGNGTFSNSNHIDSYTKLGEIYPKDIDNDGDIDILALGKATYHDYFVSWYENELDIPLPITEYKYLNICNNDSIYIYDEYVTTSGIYYDSLQTSFGADSIVIINLTVNLPPEVNLSSFSQDTMCFNNQIVQLPLAIPNGGIYEYNSDTIITFNLMNAMIGENLITYAFTDLNNCTNSDSTSIILLDCLNLKDNTSLSKFSIYPNPSTSNITVNLQSETNELVSVELIDVTLKTIYQTIVQSTSKTQINLVNISTGIYYVKLSLKEEVYVKRIIKI